MKSLPAWRSRKFNHYWLMRFLYITQRRNTVGLLWTSGVSLSQRPLPHNTQHSQQTDTHAHGEIRTRDRGRRAAVDLRIRPRGHWHRLDFVTISKWSRRELQSGRKKYRFLSPKTSHSFGPQRLHTVLRQTCRNYRF